MIVGTLLNISFPKLILASIREISSISDVVIANRGVRTLSKEVNKESGKMMVVIKGTKNKL